MVRACSPRPSAGELGARHRQAGPSHSRSGQEPAPDGRLIAPDEGGLTNFRSPSFDPKTGLFIVDAHPSYSIYFSKPADGTYGWSGADYGLWGNGVIEAIDYQTARFAGATTLAPTARARVC